MGSNMTNSIIPTFNTYYNLNDQHQNQPSPYCTLQWRRGQLLVKCPRKVKQPYLAALDGEQSLVECLKHSPINLVRIDPTLGEAKLLLWASACKQANKPIFLHIPSADKLPKPSSSLLWWLKRFTYWIAALVFLLFMSPVMLGLVLLIRVDSPGSVFSRQWHIGERGKLFQAIKFRTTASVEKTFGEQPIAPDCSLSEREDDRITLLGSWLRKSGLENLPQLLNVLRGEMSLVGRRCLTLREAVRLSREGQGELNRLPGITESWEMEANPNLLHLDSQTL